MSPIDMKCPYCGSDIELDDTKEFGSCTFCGSKVTIADVPADRSEKLNDLIKAAKDTVINGSAGDISDIAYRILGIDADNWYGWFCKGAAAAKINDCVTMYDCWSMALETMTEQDYRDNEDLFIHYATVGLIGHGFDAWDTGNATPYEFVFGVADLTREDEERFVIKVLRNVLDFESYIGIDNVQCVMTNAGSLVRTEMEIYCDIEAVKGSLKCLFDIDDTIRNDTSLFRSKDNRYTGEVCRQKLIPFRELYEKIERYDYSEEQLERCMDHWYEEGASEYTKYFDEATNLAYKMFYAGALDKIKLKRDIGKNLDKMLQVYFGVK